MTSISFCLGRHSPTVCGTMSTAPCPSCLQVLNRNYYTGIPTYRTRVLYVPQRPSLLPGTPRDFLKTISTFSSRNPRSGLLQRKGHDSDNTAVPDLKSPLEVAKAWGIEDELWDRSWGNLSGGESQRISLAIGVGLRNAEILLLDGELS